MISPQGYTYGEDPKSDNPFWTDDELKENVTATAEVNNTTGTPAVEVTKDGYNFNFSFSGIKGERGEQGDTGKDGIVDYSEVVTGISIENENGVYGIKQTKGTGNTAAVSDVGSIEVPNTASLIAEVHDSVVENNTAGYDFHTIKETENNGTQNDVGKFYVAQKQITRLSSDGSFTTVDQEGNEGTGKIAPPPELQKWEGRISDDNDFIYGYPINFTVTIADVASTDTVRISLNSDYFASIRTYKPDGNSTANFSPSPLYTGNRYTDVTAGQLETYPQIAIPYAGDAVSDIAHINHLIYGANDYSIQTPLLVLDVSPVFNNDGSATFTVTLHGFYMNKTTNDTIQIGARTNQSSGSNTIIEITKVTG